MNQARMEDHHRAGRAFGRDDAATIDQLRDRLVVDRPERIAGGRQIVAGRDGALFVRARYEEQRAVELVDLIEKHRDVHRAGIGHVVIGLPGAVVLVPLPDVAVESLFAIDLELVHVDRLAEDLRHRVDHAGMASELGEGLVHQMGRKDRANRVRAFFANHFLALLAIERRHFGEQHRHFLLAEKRIKEQIAVPVKGLELRGGQFHSRLR